MYCLSIQLTFIERFCSASQINKFQKYETQIYKFCIVQPPVLIKALNNIENPF